MNAAAKGCRCLEFVAIKVIIIVYVGCLLSLSINGDEGRTLSEEEHLEVNKEFQHLSNKPVVQTIETTYGDTYDCVDFHHQPAFDHPLLQNYSSLEMKGSSNSKEMKPIPSTSAFSADRLWKNGKGCPEGTVPIRKLTKEDLIENKLDAKLQVSSLDSVNNAKRPGTHSAVVHTKGGKYYGAGMKASVWNPRLTDKTQYSSAQMKLQNGPDSITIGWTVNPNVYKDYKTHMFIYTDTAKTRCMRTRCGFVLVRPDFPPDVAFGLVSTRGGPIYEEHFFTYKDAANGNWYLELQNGTDYSVPIGWWPNQMFSPTGLGDSATYIEWGGEVFSPPNIPSPAMGSGAFPPVLMGNLKDNAYIARLSIVNAANKAVDATNLEAFSDLRKLYRVENEGNGGNYFRSIMFYGGPGGHTGN